MATNEYGVFIKSLLLIAFIFFGGGYVYSQDDNLTREAKSDKKVKVIEKVEYYSVSASSKKELVNALKKSSPIMTNGDGFLGQTETHFKWTIDWLFDNNSCWVKNENVELLVTFRMPKLEKSGIM